MTDEELTEIYNEANGLDPKRHNPITTERIFAAMRAAMAIECRFVELRCAAGCPIRRETNPEKSARVLRIAGGTQGDVVGANGTARLYVCFAQDGNVMYVDYDA